MLENRSLGYQDREIPSFKSQALNSIRDFRVYDVINFKRSLSFSAKQDILPKRKWINPTNSTCLPDFINRNIQAKISNDIPFNKW